VDLARRPATLRSFSHVLLAVYFARFGLTGRHDEVKRNDEDNPLETIE